MGETGKLSPVGSAEMMDRGLLPFLRPSFNSSTGFLAMVFSFLWALSQIWEAAF